MPLMKKLLLIALAIVVIAAGSVVAGNHYKQYQNKKQASAIKMVPASQFEALKGTTTSELQTLQKDNARLTAECQKGVVAYGKLTNVLKTQTAPPVCTAPQE